MNPLKDKHILLGVCSSIAVYKAADLTSKLVKAGACVKVVMTENAAKLVNPLIFQTLSKNKVYVSMWENQGQWEVEHVAIADFAQIFLVAPCSANTLGNFANGLAPDFLSTCFMASNAKKYVALAMNCNMYNSSAVQKNIKTLKEWGVNFIDPQSGMLACGKEGVGRLADIDSIIAAISE